MSDLHRNYCTSSFLYFPCAQISSPRFFKRCFHPITFSVYIKSIPIHVQNESICRGRGRLQPAFAFFSYLLGATHVYKPVNILDENIATFANLAYYVLSNYYVLCKNICRFVTGYKGYVVLCLRRIPIKSFRAPVV